MAPAEVREYESIEEGAGGIREGASPAIPTAFCWRRGKGACSTVNLSSDDALDVLQISCRSRARSRQGFARRWAKAHPTRLAPIEEAIRFTHFGSAKKVASASGT